MEIESDLARVVEEGVYRMAWERCQLENVTLGESIILTVRELVDEVRNLRRTV
jgi:hypothetical protein